MRAQRLSFAGGCWLEFPIRSGFYDELIAGGICFTDMKVMANFVSENYGKYNDWWNSKLVQEKRDTFLAKNILCSDLLEKQLIELSRGESV